jgi:hypothetical protein
LTRPRPDWSFLDEDPEDRGPPEEIEGQEALLDREEIEGQEAGEDPPPAIEEIDTGGRT